MLSTPFFNVSSDALAQQAEAMQQAHLKVPLFAWEIKNKGYSSPADRTPEDTLKREKWNNCRTIEKIEAKLRPNPRDEIVAFLSINPIEKHEEKARSIGSDILKNANFRYWSSFLEPTLDGIPHYHILIRISRRALKRLEIYLDELSEELFKTEGFCGIVDLAICDSDSWNNHKEGHWPWPLGYCAKYAYNLDKILSFKSWLSGRRWVRESRKCIRPPSDEKSDLSPYGSVPRHNDENSLIKSIPAENAAIETSSEDEQLEREGRDLNDNLADQLTEHLGRNLNDFMSDLSRVTPEPTSPPKPVKPQLSEAQKKNKDSAYAMFIKLSESIKRFREEEGTEELSIKINNSMKNRDREFLSRFSLTLKNKGIKYDYSQIQILEKDIKESIARWDGKDGPEKYDIANLRRELAKHDHVLKLASVHLSKINYMNAMRDFAEQTGLSERLANRENAMKNQFTHHRKVTAQGHNLKRDMDNLRSGNIDERLKAPDLRLDKTRAKHGEEPDVSTVVVKLSSEIKAREKSREIIDAEKKAFHEKPKRRKKRA